MYNRHDWCHKQEEQKCCNKICCIEGSVGPQGPIGATGITGATGATGPNNSNPTFASLCKVEIASKD